MIVTLEAPNRATYAAVVNMAWQRGVEILPLTGLQMEIWSGDDARVEAIVNKYKVNILHKEKTKVVTGDELQSSGRGLGKDVGEMLVQSIHASIPHVTT